MNPNASDVLLVESCLEGSPGAWNRLVDQVIGIVNFTVHETGWSLGYNPESEEVETIVAEVFNHLLKADCAVLKKYLGQCKLTSYLSVVGQKIAMEEWKKKLVNPGSGVENMVERDGTADIRGA